MKQWLEKSKYITLIAVFSMLLASLMVFSLGIIRAAKILIGFFQVLRKKVLI